MDRCFWRHSLGTPDRGRSGTTTFSIIASDGEFADTVEVVVTVASLNGEIQCKTDFGDPAESPFILPFQVGETQNVIQSYCPENPNWGHHNWFAYDFDTAIGDTIVATRAGVVLFTREHFTDGNRVPGEENFVFVRHADSTVMHYMHLTQNGALVEVGDTVAQGQPIALSGDTGGSTGPHVHIALFTADRTGFERQFTLPINFRNAQGPLDQYRGLIFQANYTALSFTPDDR